MSDSFPIVILAGGKGSRLYPLTQKVPKPMVEIGGKPFLFWLVQHLHKQGFSTFILSAGYLAKVIEDFPWQKEVPGATITCFQEAEPLGTGGALRALYQRWSILDKAWVVNGDTILASPLPKELGPEDATFLALKAAAAYDARPNLWVEGSLVHRTGAGGQVFDAGAVFLSRAAIERYKGSAPCSLHQLLAPAMSERRVGYRLIDGPCYDIGTPLRLERFERERSHSIPSLRW